MWKSIYKALTSNLTQRRTPQCGRIKSSHSPKFRECKKLKYRLYHKFLHIYNFNSAALYLYHENQYIFQSVSQYIFQSVDLVNRQNLRSNNNEQDAKASAWTQGSDAWQQYTIHSADNQEEKKGVHQWTWHTQQYGNDGSQLVPTDSDLHQNEMEEQNDVQHHCHTTENPSCLEVSWNKRCLFLFLH